MSVETVELNIEEYIKKNLVKGDRARIAREAGVSRGHITHWLNGTYKNKPSDYDTLIEIATKIIQKRKILVSTVKKMAV